MGFPKNSGACRARLGRPAGFVRGGYKGNDPTPSKKVFEPSRDVVTVHNVAAANIVYHSNICGMAPGRAGRRRAAGQPSSRAAGQAGAGQPGSRAAGQPSSRAAEQPSSRAAEQPAPGRPGSRAAGAGQAGHGMGARSRQGARRWPRRWPRRGAKHALYIYSAWTAWTLGLDRALRAPCPVCPAAF